MNFGLENQVATEAYADSPKRLQQVSFRKQIQLEIESLERQLAKKKEMLALIDANPAIEKFMDLSRGY